MYLEKRNVADIITWMKTYLKRYRVILMAATFQLQRIAFKFIHSHVLKADNREADRH